MPASIHIRKAITDDIPFLVGSNQSLARETEGKNLDSDVVHQGVRSFIAQPENGFYLIAEIGGLSAGSLMITLEWSDWRNGFFWWIQSVYVKSNFRRQGVYRALTQQVRVLASLEKNVCGFRLYVEKENGVAQETYRSLGMVETNYRMFEEPLDLGTKMG